MFKFFFVSVLQPSVRKQHNAGYKHKVLLVCCFCVFSVMYAVFFRLSFANLVHNCAGKCAPVLSAI